MKKKVLVIDDEADIREIVRLYLTDEGCAVIEASNGQEGILKAQTEQPDLIILDIMLPGINGFEVAKHLKDDPNTQHIPIIILSVLAQDSQYRQGILDYISKPFRPEDLVATVRKIFSKISSKTNKKTVLIVDDDPDIVDVISICLKDNDITPERAYYVVNLILNGFIGSIEFLSCFALCKMPGYFSTEAIAFCRPRHNFSGQEAPFGDTPVKTLF